MPSPAVFYNGLAGTEVSSSTVKSKCAAGWSSMAGTSTAKARSLPTTGSIDVSRTMVPPSADISTEMSSLIVPPSPGRGVTLTPRC